MESQHFTHTDITEGCRLNRSSWLYYRNKNSVAPCKVTPDSLGFSGTQLWMLDSFSCQWSLNSRLKKKFLDFESGLPQMGRKNKTGLKKGCQEKDGILIERNSSVVALVAIFLTSARSLSFFYIHLPMRLF